MALRIGISGWRYEPWRGIFYPPDLAQRRDEPIPVYAEMSSINPVILLPNALEQRAEAILRQRFPQLLVTASYAGLPERKEYERTSTTVINAYVGPPVKAYLRSLMDQLEKGGLRGGLRVMQSSGGIISADAVVARPAQIIECGPAAGVIGAADLARQRVSAAGGRVLGAVLNDPADDGARLVYADWLDETGADPARAELIRLQCRIAAMEAHCLCGRCVKRLGGGQHTNGPCAVDQERVRRPCRASASGRRRGDHAADVTGRTSIPPMLCSG